MRYGAHGRRGDICSVTQILVCDTLRPARHSGAKYDIIINVREKALFYSKAT